MANIFNRILKWTPLVLFILLLMVDRDNLFHVVGYLIFLFSYTAVIILRVLYAKKEWHKDFNSDELDKNSSIKKMSDLQNKIKD